MAVTAQQDTFRSLSARSREGPAISATDSEGLRIRIEMVKLECPGMPVVSTVRTRAAGLSNETLLETSAPLGHAVRLAGRAPVMASRIPHEQGGPVTTAGSSDLSRFQTRIAHPCRVTGLQSIPVHPIPNRGHASVDQGRDLPQRVSVLDPLLELGAIETTLPRVFPTPRVHEPVLLQPIADRRRVLSLEVADALERQPGLQRSLLDLPLHAGMIEPGPDGKNEHMFALL